MTLGYTTLAPKYRREQLVGEEGGSPPIHLQFFDWDTDEMVGEYVVKETGWVKARGKIFERFVDHSIEMPMRKL